MIIQFLSRHNKAIAWSFYFLFYGEWLFASAGSGHEGRDWPVPAYAGRASKGPQRDPAAGLWPAGLGSMTDRVTMTPEFRIHKEVSRHVFGGGPTQPEMQAFQSVNANNMVDLFSGDFSYNIPLMDVGGYPVNLGYRSGISMDQEASWVGLGWNVNPGTVTRNLRGLPDDFNGNDSIKKTTSIKENKTIGVTGGGEGDLEVAGFPMKVEIGANLGIFHNNYKGWGLENGVNAGINAGGGTQGGLSGGLSISAKNNSQDGLTLTPSLSIGLAQKEADDASSLSGSFSVAMPYNSRSGLKGLQLSIGARQSQTDMKNQKSNTYSTGGGAVSGEISFASPGYTPTITMPLTTKQFTFTAKAGFVDYVVHPSFYLSGYVSSQFIDDADRVQSLPAYGYLHYTEGANNRSALMDMNREKELVYREKPAIPHIAVPLYTYDAFSITGEGTGGMFRPYRGDIGYVFDHFVRTRDGSDRLSIDLGGGNLVHAGVDLNVTRSFTQNSAWTEQNTLSKAVAFRRDSGLFESVYFRNPGEKSINSKKFYETIGGDDVVTAKLFQPSSGSSVIQATNYLTLYRNKRPVADSLMTPSNAIKPERDKRTQVISYLNAQEADIVGLNKYIENYTPNVFTGPACVTGLETLDDHVPGIVGYYYPNYDFKGTPKIRMDNMIDFVWAKNNGANNITAVFPDSPAFPHNYFSVRWEGQLLAPTTGKYTIGTYRDDAVRLTINDTVLIDTLNDQGFKWDSAHVNLVAGQYYKVKLEYRNKINWAEVALGWTPPGTSPCRCGVDDMRFYEWIQPKNWFQPSQDSFPAPGLVREKRVNSFRKANHISEVDVLNNDGRRYVYGIPVYNLKQKEATFNVLTQNGNTNTSLVKYVPGVDNTVGNRNGKDAYFNSEEMPAYAHSFLLTGILSPDYVDLTGNGISDDDKGDAVKFDYSKICGIGHPYRWRAPYYDSSSGGAQVPLGSYNEGLRTDNRDDKANYVYGEKELWYLHTIQSKTMIATFVVENRSDLFAIDESGHKYIDNTAKRLKEINLYSKADFLKNGTNAIPVKTVHFEYSYDLCPGINRPLNQAGKLTLKRVWFTYNGNDKGKQNPYVFNYNTLNPSYNIKSYDRWGNFKDPAQNPTTGGLLNNAEYPYSLQDSSAAAKNSAAWSLDSVYLPSGGAIKVAFESDDYAYVQDKRAMNLFKVAGLGPDSVQAHSAANLYDRRHDNLYVFVNVPVAVSNKADLLQKYLAGVSKLYFKLFVRMPDDQWGSGFEYVSCYADLDQGNSYGLVNSNTIWLKMAGITMAGDGVGPYSPLAKAGIQFLRLNLPSKAYTGSEVGDDISPDVIVKMIFGLADNIKNAFSSFDNTARGKSWCSGIDINRSYVRLDNPNLKKYGGGYRVKRITIYDKWDKMIAGQRAAVYGQEYTYLTRQEIGGVMRTISSGVASYEPGIGGEENPFRQPIEYVEKIAPLGPVTLGYSEEPLGESVFPAAGVGYSKVRVRTINYKNRKSANGYEESSFYTAYDFPTYTDRTIIDNDTKKRYKPGLASFLKINAYHYLTFSQGFKVELNDMHGKLRSQAYYPETDPDHFTSYTENVYRVDNARSDQKRLSNVVSVMRPDGSIDTAAYIGKDVELMMDMREQLSVTNGLNVSVNADAFSVPFIPPIFVLPSLINLTQREEDRYRSVATLKVIQRYGILDSVIHIDKGSKVSTKDMLYDSETGDVLLTRTKNEFDDPVYNFSYPAHWAYDGMGGAYKNIDLFLQHVTIKRGKLVAGSSVADSLLFSSGDEILVAGKQQTGTDGCAPIPATFPNFTKIWSVDSSVLRGGRKCVYFVDEDGLPYNGNDVTLKIVRSGRRNMNSMVGSVTTLQNPLVADPVAGYKLVLNETARVVNAGAAEFGQYWKVEDALVRRTNVQIVGTSRPCYDTIPATPLDPGFQACYSGNQYSSYSEDGPFIYPETDSIGGQPFDDPTGWFWENNGNNTTDGRLNRIGIWQCNGCVNQFCTPTNVAIGFTVNVYNPQTDTVFVGFGGDNQVKVSIDDTINMAALPVGADATPFTRWQLHPVYLTSGIHSLHVEGMNSPPDGGPANPGSFGCEIYHLSRFQLMTEADSNVIKKNTIFSTASLAESQSGGYYCPYPYAQDSTGGIHRCVKADSCISYDTLTSYSCRSTVSDTVFNPYTAGVLGNWRGSRSYTHFGTRAETDPSGATNIRKNGSFHDFAPFWKFQGGRLAPQYDTTRWVWNSELTMFNPKGMEIENRDPLGRYNSILYGYDLSLPVAVTQNGHYRETAFEGFEDYGFLAQACAANCASSRHFDWSSYLSKLTTAQKHSGKSSLKLDAGDQVGISFNLVAQEPGQAFLNYVTAVDVCAGIGTVLNKIQIPSSVLLPSFSPFKGRQMVVSAWVKEEQSCTCSTYVNNDVKVAFTGGTAQAFTFAPTGNIVEGWQRYEAVFTIPLDATLMSINLEANGSTAAYFDDLRVHPFNANMKSFVYNPVNLRLMAEQDENNYSTFYEYDDDGTLIRVKKETEKGIQTIKETRSALLKQ